MAETKPLKKGQKTLMDRLNKSRDKNANTRARGKVGKTDTMSDRAKPKASAPEKKPGVPAKRSTTEPARFKKPGTSVTEYKKPGTSVTEYKKPGTAVTEYKKPNTSVDKPRASVGSVGSKSGSYAAEGLKTLGKVGGVYVDMIANAKPLNQGEKEWIADKKNRGPLMKGNSQPSVKTDKEKRKTPVPPSAGRKADNPFFGNPKINAQSDAMGVRYSVGKRLADSKKSPKVTKAVSAPTFADKQQGMKDKRSPTYSPSADKDKKTPTVKSAAPSTPKKMSNFEQAKARNYEKEGYGGRSMTADSAKKQALKERKYTFADLFKKKK